MEIFSLGGNQNTVNGNENIRKNQARNSRNFIPQMGSDSYENVGHISNEGKKKKPGIISGLLNSIFKNDKNQVTQRQTAKVVSNGTVTVDPRTFSTVEEARKAGHEMDQSVKFPDGVYTYDRTANIWIRDYVLERKMGVVPANKGKTDQEKSLKIKMMDEKFRRGTLNQVQWMMMLNDEYARIRSLGDYAKKYGANNFSDSLNNIYSAVFNPSDARVNLLHQHGWVYRLNGRLIPSDEIKQRMSLNVKGDSRLIRQLDELMTTGQYIDETGKRVQINRTDFYYKTYENIQSWGDREDPITLYFRGNVNKDTCKAIAQITKRFVRGTLNGAENTATPWLIIEESPSTQSIYDIVKIASRYNPKLSNAIYDICTHNGTREPICSSGQYRAFQSILSQYAEYVSLLNGRN